MKMNNIAKYFLAMLIFPSLAIAQNPEYYDSLSFKLRNYFEICIGWALVSLVLISISTLIALILVRKKGKRVRAPITFGFLIFCVWYFYPAFTFKGTYAAMIRGQIETFIIDEAIRIDEENSDFNISYHAKPFHRMLWTEFHNPSPHFEHLPVRLGWNKFHLPTWYEGIVEYKKVKTSGPIK